MRGRRTWLQERRDVSPSWRRCSSASAERERALANGPLPEEAEPNSLVIGKSFDLVTMDPGRMFETTGGIIIPAMYDTLLTFAEQRRHRADAGPRRELGGQRGRHRVHVHAARRRRLLRRLTRRGRRRRLLAQPGARAEEQRRVPDGRRHRRGGRRVDGPAHHRGAQPGAAADPADPDAGHRQQRRRHRERGHRPARRRRRRRRRGVPQLDVGGIRPVHPGELQHDRRDAWSPPTRSTSDRQPAAFDRIVVPQQRRHHAGDRRAERQRRHRHGPRQRPARDRCAAPRA